MPLSTFGKNKILDLLGASHVSVHSAAPNDSGSNEISGGSYARQSITWNSAASGAIDSSNAPVIPIPAGTTFAHIGFWDALSGGNFLGYGTVPSETFGSADNYTLNDADIDLNS